MAARGRPHGGTMTLPVDRAQKMKRSTANKLNFNVGKGLRAHPVTWGRSHQCHVPARAAGVPEIWICVRNGPISRSTVRRPPQVGYYLTAARTHLPRTALNTQWLPPISPMHLKRLHYGTSLVLDHNCGCRSWKKVSHPYTTNPRAPVHLSRRPRRYAAAGLAHRGPLYSRT
ncbi:ACL115Wp [Eremothecium gossypii ATCC 10895]|uniref:ACL115Wp n=1 Tax=Eremothecium gossypii (strain ATCC 10895 / CBS 109.51 / FGSC 9923 / NRRL Y-1056) TaxID=284811 RepID=Q75CN4_EREGS|nr:ACL115Wp [Eremothecium gossypii ATCC 10895]AAS51113.1 ACL115Wp [Eremothecium gossypii ATCC 10895]AEY95403.1 FACL115Wp [Eremothecium gossypii FDAG1]